MKKYIYTILCLIGTVLGANTAFAATNFLALPASKTVTVGDTFMLEYNVHPQGIANYTIGMDVRFTSDLLSFSSLKMADEWFPLKQAGYDLTDNVSGRFVRTAGYPGGASSNVHFGTATFTAKKAGKAYIQFAGNNVAYDANNANVFSSGNVVEITVLPKAVKKEPVVIAEEEPIPEADKEEVTLPEQLFDIRLAIENPAVADIRELKATADFVSFGSVPTPVLLTFDIITAEGRVVYSENTATTVETTQVMRKTFPNVYLDKGNYALRLTTVYNTDVTDEFWLSFEVTGKKEVVVPVEKVVDKEVLPLWQIIALGLALLVLGFLLGYFAKRKKNRENDEMRMDRSRQLFAEYANKPSWEVEQIPQEEQPKELSEDLTVPEQKILAYIHTVAHATTKDIVEKTAIRTPIVRQSLKHLTELGKLQRTGNGRTLRHIAVIQKR